MTVEQLKRYVAALLVIDLRSEQHFAGNLLYSTCSITQRIQYTALKDFTT